MPGFRSGRERPSSALDGASSFEEGLDRVLLGNLPIVGLAVAIAFLLAVILRLLGQAEGPAFVHLTLPVAMMTLCMGVAIASRLPGFKPAWAHPVLTALVVVLTCQTAYRYVWGEQPYESLNFVMILVGVGGLYTRWLWFLVTFVSVGAVWAFTLSWMPVPVRSIPLELLEWFTSALALSALFFISRRRAFEAYHEQACRLVQVNALKNAFVNDLVHELRNPLVAVRGFAELLEDGVGGPLSPEQRVFVEQIQRNTERQERRLNDLLDEARIESGEFRLARREIDWGASIREVVSDLAGGARARGVSLVFEGPEAPVPAYVDPERIAQIVMNLVGNALKFSPDGATIRVRASATERKLALSVRDEGPGIALVDQGRLFQRFSQLEAGRSIGGSGLGLAICKTLVEAHGGTLGVESVPGRGACFWVELPRNGGAQA